MAATIKRETGIESEVVRGSGGIFVVTIDNERVFSKHDEGRFPSEAEIVKMLRDRASAAGTAG